MSRRGRLMWLTLALAASCAAASAFGIFSAATYSQESPLYAAQGVGQDWVNLLLVSPALIVMAVYAKRGSRRALFTLGGFVLYALYSYILYAFTLHFNDIFLLYCLVLSLGFFGFVEWCFVVRAELSRIRLPNRVFSKTAAGFQVSVAAFFAVLWLSEIIPAHLNGVVPKSVTDSGLATNAVHVLDLSILLPAFVVSSVALLKKKIHGVLLSVALLWFVGIMATAIAAMVGSMWFLGFSTDTSVAGVMLALAACGFFLAKRFVDCACAFPKVILLVGVPGSGKSTVAKKRFASPAYAIHSTDAIRAELFGDESTQGSWEQIEGVLKLREAQSLEKGVTPIVDATHAQKEHRVAAIRWMNRLGAEAHALYVATPLETCQQRNAKRDRVVPAQVIENMHAALLRNPPRLSDGFEVVETVRD